MSKKYINTINIAFYLEKDLRIFCGSELQKGYSHELCEVVAGGLSEMRQNVVTPHEDALVHNTEVNV